MGAFSRSAGLVVLVSAFAPAAVAAQSIAPPPRSAAPRAQNDPLTTSLTLDGSFTGGYDNEGVAAVAGQAGGDVLTSGYNAFGGVGLDYARFRGLNRFDVHGRGYINSYPGSDIEPGFGTSLGVGGSTGFGRNRLSANADARYEPFFSLGAFAGAPTSVDEPASPEVSPVNGLVVDQHSWNTNAFTELSRQWSRRHSTSTSYAFQNIDRRGALGNDLTSQSVQLSHMVGVGRSAQVGAGYTFGTSDMTEASTNGDSGQITTHGLEMRTRVEKRISPTRRLGISASGGGQRVEVLSIGAPETNWVPSASAALRIDIGRAWALQTDYRHGVATLGGVTSEAFSSDMFTFAAGGPLGPRASLALSSGWAGGASSPLGGAGTYTTYTLTTQFSFNISRYWSTMVNYTLYDYRLTDLADTPAIIPRDLTRGSLRFGMTISLPLLEAPRVARQPRRS